MSKPTIFITLLFLVNFLVFPQIASAASITPIDNLNLDESKSVTVSGLEANQNYYWVERKQTIAIYLPGQDPYTTIFTDCIDSDNTGKIVQDLGPYRATGFYKLVISKASDREGCFSSGNEVVSQEFSVGGPLRPAKDCCSAGVPVYNRDKDLCQNQWILPTVTIPTQCTGPDPANPQSFCEPESLKCFQTKTLIIRGKICWEGDPKDSGFDPDKYAICNLSGGQKAPGCTDNQGNPGIATAVGCIHTSPTELIKDLLKFVVGISGGLAFLMMLLGAFQMLTSAGNPETLSAGKDRLTSAVIGLLFVIFAILLLQIIGVDILKIPGFGR